MASIEAQIAVILKGTSELDKLQSKLDAILNTSDQIAKQAIEVQLGRVSDVTTYTEALKAVGVETKKVKADIKVQERSNAEIKKAIELGSRLRRERSLVSRFTREFTIETKGLDQSAGQLKDIKTRFDNLREAFGKAFELQDVGIIGTLRNELRSLVQEQRDWNRTLTGTKKTGVNADFLQEQARGYQRQIDALRARAQALGENEQILRKLGAAEYNLVKQRTPQGTFTGLADPRLGKEQLANATKLIQQQEAQRKAASSFARENKKLSSAAVALEKQRQSALEKIFQVEEKIRSSKKISLKEAQDYYFQAQLPRLALPFGDPNQPAMRGGARRGGVSREVLGGARTADEAAATLRLAQATQKLGQAAKSIDPQYNRFLPDEKMLNASGRGIQRLTTNQEEFNEAVASGIRFQEKYNREQERLRKIYGAGMPAGTAQPGATATSESASGLEKALGSLQEARGARERFFGGASPAEAIDQIVREFNTGKPAASEAAGNITQTFSSGLKKGAAGAASAAKSFATAATQAINKVFGIKSPSRFMIELVQNLTNTFIAEMQKSYPRIQAATQKAFGQQTLLRDVNKLTATSKGFEFTGRPSTGFRPLAMGAGTEGVSEEFQEMMNTFRKQIAGLTIQPEIYQNLLKALPDSRITTDLAGAASRRALASEQLPSFMPTQRMLGPGELEGTIARAAADYFRTVRTPDPWVGLVGDYKKFIDGITAATRKLTSPLALPPARVAGALPPALFASGLSPAQELRRLRAYQRSEERGAAVMGEATARGPSQQLALPPAASRTLQDAISNLFNRISDTARRIPTTIGGAFGGGGPRGPVGFGGPGGPPPPPPNGPEQMARTLLGLDALGDISRISTRELEALSAIFAELRAVLDPTIQGFDRLDNQLRETIGSIGRQVERREPNADFLTRNIGPRAGRAISEGMIGGAFPLLFGQGVGASVGGLVGGAAGGFAGDGLGFGLSLIGTALGSAFDTAVQSATELGTALIDTSKAFELVKSRALFSSKETEKLATKLGEAGFLASASILAQQEIIDKVGASGYKSLTNLADSSDRANRAWAEFNLQLQTALAGPMAGLLEWVTSILKLRNQSFQSQRSADDLSAGLTERKKEEFDSKILGINFNELVGSAIGLAGPVDPTGILFGGIDVEEAAKQRSALIEFYEDFAVPVKVKLVLTDKQKTEQELAILGKELEALNIGKSFKDAARQAAREQQDLDKQRADLVRSYEESIANFRKQVEDEISRRRFSILEKENQLLDLQGQRRIRELQAANAEAVAFAGRGERDEVAGVAKEVAQIVADFTEQQLSAEEEAAKIKRNAARFDFEAGQFKVNIEKEVAKLNIETARQVSQINENVRRRNEETDLKRFNIEKRIAEIQLGVIETDLKILRTTYALPPETVQGIDTILGFVDKQIKEISAQQPPARLSKVAPVGGGAGPSMAGFDAIVAQEKKAIQALVDEALKGVNSTAELSGATLAQRFLNLADSIDKPLQDIETRQADAEVARLRRIELVNAGLTDGVAQRVMELEQVKKIALAQYDSAIAQLESKIVAEANTQQLIDQNLLYEQQIELIRQRKDALEGKFGTFDSTTGTGTGAIGSAVTSERGNEIQEFITKTTAELNNLEQVAINVSQGIGNAVGSSLANGITGLIEGTTTAKEVFAGFLKDVGQILIQEGTKMIAMYIAIAIAKAIAGLSNISSTPTPGSAPQMTPGAIVTPKGFSGQSAGMAANGATFANGIATFASGGAFTNSVVSSPTLFKFANGGTAQTGLMGEAGPEAIMPLSRNASGRLGVDATGLREAMGTPPGAAGNAPMLNMSFQTSTINGVEYVSRDQLEQAMVATRRQAANDGAKRGMNMTLDKIQNSPSTRSRVGIR